MSKYDSQARPIHHHWRELIEAHASIVFTALTIRQWIEHQTGWSIGNFVIFDDFLGPAHGSFLEVSAQQRAVGDECSRATCVRVAGRCAVSGLQAGCSPSRRQVPAARCRVGRIVLRWGRRPVE